MSELMRRATTPQGGQVGRIPRNITTLGTGQISVTTTPQQISYVDENRACIKITNLSSVEVFYGSTIGVSSTTGDLLPAGRGQWIEIPGGSTIFVVIAPATPQVNGLISWAEIFD